MGTEIERKFVVVGDGWRGGAVRSVVMVQGYMRSEDVAIRVRTQGERAVVTFKARESGAVRGEWEYEIPVADAEELIARFCGERVVRKTRHYVDVANHTWEIDVFEGRHAGLVIAELELGSEDEAFDHPSWLGAEVTDEASYYNEALALGDVPNPHP